jgi:uncharacterized damage-inducible protein DinB
VAHEEGEQMATEAGTIAAKVEKLAREALEQMEGLPEKALNQRLPLPETNSLYALATHLVGAGEFWTVTVVGGRDIPRDREGEFTATGTLAALRERYERWLTMLHEDLDGLRDAEMERVMTLVGPVRAWMAGDQLTVRESLLHALEHTALHLGHIQLTRQLQLDKTQG